MTLDSVHQFSFLKGQFLQVFCMYLEGYFHLSLQLEELYSLINIYVMPVHSQCFTEMKMKMGCSLYFQLAIFFMKVHLLKRMSAKSC